MHFGLSRIVSLLFLVFLAVDLHAQGGFGDFNDDIILEDKKDDTSDLDFMENGKESEETKKKQSVDDEDVLSNLEKEAEKTKEKEKKEAKKSEDAPQKRTLKESSETPQTTETKNTEDDLLLKEEEEEQAEIEADEQPKAPSQKTKDDLDGVPEDPDLKAIEKQESEMEPEEKTAEPSEKPTTEEAPEQIVEQEIIPSPPTIRNSRKWRKTEPRIVLPRDEEEEGTEPIIEGDVEVEKSAYGQQIFKKCNCRYDALTPYTLRRDSWTNTFSLGGSTYRPTNYESEHFDGTLEDVFGSSEMPMFEITFGFKKNLSIGALSLDVGAGYYSDTNGDSVLKLTLGTAAATLYLDNIFNEPYVVPYGTVGVAYVFYSEALASNEAGGGTPTMYAGGGLGLQLDWLDEQADVDSYEDFGLENTFLYIEGRFYPNLIPGTSGTSPDFSSDKIAILSGLKFEF